FEIARKKLEFPTIELFVKAGTGTDRESIGPLSQRLFMILWLKGIIFSITTITPKLQAVAPGKHPLFVIFNGEHKVDVNQTEERSSKYSFHLRVMSPGEAPPHYK
uniref:CLIC N-terminal domain-containing protein n=1 Tax=Paramormyrops kingsleyae TaxID=1676925 RepID=A0A3B3RCE4_9TELE